METRKHLRLISKKTALFRTGGFFVPFLKCSDDVTPPQVVFGVNVLSTRVVLVSISDKTPVVTAKVIFH